jgi:lipid A 4'-phosphatase
MEHLLLKTDRHIMIRKLRQKDVIYEVWMPCAVLIILTLLFRLTDLDLRISGLFFVSGAGWVSKDIPFCAVIYKFAAVLPGFLLAGGALLLLCASIWRVGWQQYRRQALFLLLILGIGPGLLVNTIFKEHWGRPRPRSIFAFDGDQPFVPVWQQGPTNEGHSFPSGHAAMGFFLLTPYFLLRKTARRWALAALTTGIGYGLLIGLVRVIQGGHFASDVIWAGGFVYLTAVALSHLLSISSIET